jgi:hypothetical protein
MDAVTYPSGVVQETLQQHAVPVRVDVFQERELSKRVGAFWTPSFFYLQDGKVLHQWLGYLPPDEFAAQILLGVGLARFKTGATDAALPRFDEILSRFPKSLAAPEAVYWHGVCQFRRTKDTTPIYQACRRIVADYPDSPWAMKIGFVSKYKDFNLAG